MRPFRPVFAKLAKTTPTRARAIPAPAPLPGLADAFSRRAALFGAVTVSGVLAASTTRALPFSLAAQPLSFDPAAYVADLVASGCQCYGFRRVLSEGVLSPWLYGIAPPEGGGFGKAHRLVMVKWRDAIDACPDHAERVGAYIAGGAA